MWAQVGDEHPHLPLLLPFQSSENADVLPEVTTSAGFRERLALAKSINANNNYLNILKSATLPEYCWTTK